MLDDLIRESTSLFSDGASTVLRGHENRQRSAVLRNGSLVSNVRAEGRGVSALVYRDGVYGFSSTPEYSKTAADTVMTEAEKNASFLSSHAPGSLGPFPCYPGKRVETLRTIDDAEQKDIIERLKEIDSYITAKHPDLTARSIAYREDSQDKIIYSSDMSSGHVINPRAHIVITLSSVTKDGTPVSLSDVYGGRGGFYNYFTSVKWLFPEIDRLYLRLMDKKEGVYPEAGMKTVVLGGILTGMLAHEAVGHTVEADLVRGGSVAGPLLGREVASPLVSLVDFAHTALGKTAPLPIILDDEGVPAEDAVLIKDGILTGYMHNRETALRYGVKPQGNARAWSFGDEPLIRMRNTAILPGKDKFEDIIASVDDGYYLIDTNNGQADLTGEFMFGVTMGYEIKKGKLGRAILDTTVSGIAFDMLKSVDMVSDTVVWSAAGMCGKKQPIPVGMGGPQLRCRIMIGGR